MKMEIWKDTKWSKFCVGGKKTGFMAQNLAHDESKGERRVYITHKCESNRVVCNFLVPGLYLS